MSSEILLIDKPKGITSFDVIRILRKKLGIRKMGHAGTLDPLATGLMIIGVGEGTKKLNEYLKLDKVYEAEILIGKKTTTGDLEGEVVNELEVNKLEVSKVKSVLKSVVGKITLSVPVYSAIKVSGKPLYKRARAGEKVDPPEKQMKIHWIRFKSLTKAGKYYNLSVELKVRSGTYIRSIAEEIGKRLGSPATISNLRRVKIGNFDILNAQKLVLD